MKSRYEIFNADCLEQIKKIKDNSVDLVLIDPPYNIDKASWDTWQSVDDYVDFMSKVFTESERVLKNTGSFYFFHNDFLQIVELQKRIEKTEFIFKALITIKKKEGSFAIKKYGSQNHFRSYVHNCEYLLYYNKFTEGDDKERGRHYLMPYIQRMTKLLRKGELKLEDINRAVGKVGIASHWFLNKDGKQPQPRVICEADYLKLQKCFPNIFNQSYRHIIGATSIGSLPRTVFNAGEGIETIWEYHFNKDHRTGHPTQKPVLLLEDIIKRSSNPDGIVLDMFMGSGSTGVACANMNRKFIGIEKDKKYFKIAKERIESSMLPVKKVA
jgi:DNA modification methylase